MNKQSRVRGDQPERVPPPPPKTMFDSWRMTALCCLRLRQKRVQEQSQKEEQKKRVQRVPLVQDVSMEAAKENLDSRSIRACDGSESDVTHVGNADASETSVTSRSKKMSSISSRLQV
eukprot:1553301-Amphidinium_carterae.2